MGLFFPLFMTRALFQKAGLVKTKSVFTLRWGKLRVFSSRKGGYISSELVTVVTDSVKESLPASRLGSQTLSFSDYLLPPAERTWGVVSSFI